MFDPFHRAPTQRIIQTMLILACLSLGAGAVRPAAAMPPPEPTLAPEPPPGRALVYVPLPSADALDRFAATGLPIYAQEEEGGSAYVLAGTDRDGLRRLAAAGLRYRVLDADMAGAAYYFTAVPAGRPQPDWLATATLLRGNTQRLIRATPAEAERLVRQGAEIAQLPQAPIPLQRTGAAPLAASEAVVPDPLVQAMIDQATLVAAQGYVAQLSGETPVTVGGAPYTIGTRYTSSGTPIEKATGFVGEHLAGLGLDVEYHSWTKSGYTNRNVVGQRTGSTNPGDVYIIGAHLDDMPNGGTAPGADDNATGSAATLIAADILSQYQWGCTLRFALWTGEEQGLLGSAVYAARARTAGETIRGYLNLDMLGYNAAGPRNVDLYYRAAPAGSEQIADAFANVVAAYGLDLVPLKYNVASYSTGNYSDNKPFWDQGYPAILVIEDYQGGDFTPSYHTAGDTLSTLDLAYFTSLIKASVGAFAHMSGCLLTGALGGAVTAGHDGSPIGGASVTAADAHGLTYSAATDGSGNYGRILPVATYDLTATAYGYLPATVTGLMVSTDGAPQDFVLQAAPPVSPQVSISADPDKTRLTWVHVPPDMAYAVFRSAEPYFIPRPDNQLGSVGISFSAAIVYDDTAISGNRFYAVVGSNAAGEEAVPSRVAVFDFSLQPGQ
jgi:hypothetical protein